MKNKQNNTRIIGIDPGYGRVGYGIIEGNKNDWKLIDYGCIHTDPKKVLVDRLIDIEFFLKKIITEYKPTIGAVEELFFSKNVTTGLQVAHARGVIITTLKKAGLTLYEYTPLQIKRSITGNGRAEKSQVQTMVQFLLHLKQKPIQDDAVDALGAALTCASGMELQKNIHI